jgi:predicted CXXCH cytochrome family protein
MKIWRTLPILVVASALAGQGCDATTRYRALRFFFDGVPAQEEKKAAGIRKTEAGEIPRGTAGPTSSRHAPYAAKKCDSCHQRSTNVLIAPIDELCFRCHEFRSGKRWVHGPLASGGCRVCHEPHSSRYPFLLVSDSESFCLYCHDEKAVAANEAHKGAATKCTTCHDAHMSDSRFLLK